MSNLPASEPKCTRAPEAAVELCIEGRPRDLGGLVVQRVLPSAQRRLVGPFVFFDQMGPSTLAPGEGIDVRPHPHIALATITFLFDGEILHRDSLGSYQHIRPGDVNWMVAGRGIVHSERTGPEARAQGMELHGIQSWIALPLAHEETDPRFEHHPAASLPHLARDGVELDVIAGTAFGLRSPVGVLSPTLYVHAQFTPNSRLPVDTEHEERAVYVVEGALSIGALRVEAGTLAVLTPGREVELRADEDARVMLLGGAKLEGTRHIYWNFVASSQERIERAKDDWRAGRFPRVPGDEQEFIPLPEA